MGGATGGGLAPTESAERVYVPDGFDQEAVRVAAEDERRLSWLGVTVEFRRATKVPNGSYQHEPRSHRSHRGHTAAKPMGGQRFLGKTHGFLKSRDRPILAWNGACGHRGRHRLVAVLLALCVQSTLDGP